MSRLAIATNFPDVPGRGVREHKTVTLVLAVCAALGMVHIALGADPVNVGICLLAAVVGLFPIMLCGGLNIVSILIFLVWFRYLGFPLVGKLLLWQPIDSNLAQPFGSFLAVLAGLAGYVSAFLLADKLALGRQLLPPVVDWRRLTFVSVGAALIGISANLAVGLGAGKGPYQGVTYASFFTSFIYLALIAGTASCLVRSQGKRKADPWVIALIFCGIIASMISNSRMGLLEVLFSYLATLIAFTDRINLRHLTAAGLLLVVMSVFITPIALYVRRSRSELSWTQRITATADAIVNWDKAYKFYKSDEAHATEHGFLNYYGKAQNTWERMSLVNHVDVLKDGADHYGCVGMSDLKHAAARVLPRMLAPDKTRGFSQGAWLYSQIGLVSVHQDYYQTAPLIGDGYLSFGWEGVVLYPLLLGLPVFLLLKKMAGFSLKVNIWAIYMVLRVHNLFVEGSSDAYFLMAMRYLPQECIVMLALNFFSSDRLMSTPRRLVAAASNNLEDTLARRTDRKFRLHSSRTRA